MLYRYFLQTETFLASKTQKTNFTKLKLARFTKDPSLRGVIDVMSNC